MGTNITTEWGPDLVQHKSAVPKNTQVAIARVARERLHHRRVCVGLHAKEGDDYEGEAGLKKKYISHCATPVPLEEFYIFFSRNVQSLLQHPTAFD